MSIFKAFEELDLYIEKGFTDDMLEGFCNSNALADDKKYGYRACPQLFWTTELYSLGRCYREWLNWPKWLPIPVYGDHGADPGGALFEHEMNNRAKFHLCFFSGKYEANKNNNLGKEFIRVPDPWALFRRRHKIELSPRAKGTLVFFPHTVPGIEHSEETNIEKYVVEIKSLPEEFHPIAFCLHMHDVRRNVHKVLREYNIPLFSLGNSSSAYFVDRFYGLASRFKYASSCVGGSEIYYCSDLGCKFFLYGTEFKYVNKSHPQMELGEFKFSDPVLLDALERKRTIFGCFPPVDSDERTNWVRDVLGLDVDENVVRTRLKKIFIFEMIRLSPFYCYQLMKTLFGAFWHMGFFGTLDKMRKSF